MSVEIEYGEIERILERILGKGVRFESLVTEMTKNGQGISLRMWFSTFGNLFLEQLKNQGQNMLYFLLLIISAAVLSVIAKAFRNRQISDMGFYMIGLLMFVIMMRSFGTCYSLAERVVKDLIDFMKVLMPAYLMAVAVSSYRVSAVVYYEGFLILVYYLQRLIEVLVLPAIRCYVLFHMIGHLGKEDYFSKGKKELKRLILFLLKAAMGIVGGLQIVQGMISPAIDQWKENVWSSGISSLGNVGNVAQNVRDIMLGSSVLLKNGIGAAAALIIVSICLLPVMEVGGHAVFYQVMAAVAEPFSDKKMVTFLGDMGEGMELLVKVLFSVAAMFLLTIAIICVTTGGVS